jgi:hypothetical protein
VTAKSSTMERVTTYDGNTNGELLDNAERD